MPFLQYCLMFFRRKYRQINYPIQFILTSSFPPGISATAIALGAYHTCIIATGGGVKCWGHNGNGQLGIGSWSGGTRPVALEGALQLLFRLYNRPINGLNFNQSTECQW
jgi:alpha-tubulin suppressor-like RCC1 family protein